jgi:nucleoid-associated protein YgaU
MGSFERFIILTVVFLAAVVLAVTFRAEGPLGQKSPSEALAAAGREATLLDPRGGAGTPASRVEPTRSTPATPTASGVPSEAALAAPQDLAAAAEAPKFVPLEVPQQPGTEPRAGLLSAPARPAEPELKLWPGPEQNSLGQPRMLRDVPGLERYPVAGEDLALFSVPSGATWSALAQLLYGDEAEAESLRLANDAPAEPVAGARVLVPIYRGQMGAVSLDERPVQVQPRAPGQAGPGSSVSEPSQGAATASASSDGRTQAPAPSTPAGQAPVRTYEVMPGDSLSSIAQRFYGSPNEWRKIFAANQDVLPNPDRLTPKLVLRIP